jgi:hypothetical protein
MTQGNTRAIRECLFYAFADYYHDSQDQEQMWAIREGMDRLQESSPAMRNWRETQARKDHGCERGCPIKKGDTYFRYILGPGWGHHLNICAGCMAMILYFAEVDKLPPHISTHWDFADQRPIRLT